MEPDTPATAQNRNPLHGLTLEAILRDLVDHYGWEELGRRVALRCFVVQPSINSSLKVLRKTPWARANVENLYVATLRERARLAKPSPADADVRPSKYGRSSPRPPREEPAS